MHNHEHLLPDIDCVLIGVNAEKTLGQCIESIRLTSYPQHKIHIIYVDGGSSDGSIASAKRYEGITIIAINPEYPSPGLGRNSGWKIGSSPLVQFLDSDTTIHPHWFDQAVRSIHQRRVGAIMGMREEMHPERSVYNWIGNIEWNGPAGESDCFGGDVLIRREALEITGGYDEELVGGEDPELSRRLIRAGWKIMRLHLPMTRHDLAMTKIGQYLRRAYRSGYGFGAVRAREAIARSDFWKYEYRKVTIKGGGFSAASLIAIPLFTSGVSHAWALALLVSTAGTIMILIPRLFKVRQFMCELQLERKEAKRYAWHCSLVVLPQLAGIIRYHVGHVSGKPLRNRRNRLATRTSNCNP